MKKGVLLFCFDTVDHKYHKILERCVHLIKKHLGLEITVVTDFDTFKNLEPLGFINYKFIEPELGNKKIHCVSIKYNESKNPGSLKKAERACYRELNYYGRKYGEIGYWISGCLP